MTRPIDPTEGGAPDDGTPTTVVRPDQDGTDTERYGPYGFFPPRADAPVDPLAPGGPGGPGGPDGPDGPTGGGFGGSGGGGFGGSGGEPPSGGPQPAGPAPESPTRRLSRSRGDRVATGLAGGLGRYFGVDPVIFRVVFAVLALFGGSGIVLYLVGWLAVPDEDAVNAPIDRVVDRMRRWRIPFALVLAVGLLVIWLAAFSWWEPLSIFPAILVIIALFLLLGRRNRAVTDSAPSSAEASAPAGAFADTTPLEPAGVQLRSWFEESKARGRERRRRSAPITRTVAVLLLLTLATLAVVDLVTGIPFGTYFWVIGGVTVAGLAVGLITRRTPRWLPLLLIPAAIGVVSFGTSSASAHDGLGDRTWRPDATTAVASNYHFGFGRSTLDLTAVGQPAADKTIKVQQGAGQVRLMIPRALPVKIEAHVHQGVVTVEGTDLDNGWQVDATSASAAATDAANVITLDVHLTAGQVWIDYI
jgi:phage shock protein PspC (stress-responsive transcriptional regulator)